MHLLDRLLDLALRRNASLQGYFVGDVFEADRWRPVRQIWDYVRSGQHGRSAIPVGETSSYLLFDAKTGRHLAALDGGELTDRRTAATAALAASYLAPADARRLLVVGAGRVAANLADAFRAVRPIEDVTVWNINAGECRGWREG